MASGRPMVVDNAISYQALLDFAQRSSIPSSFPDISTEDVVERFVLPATRIQSTSYANMLPSNQVSMPTFLVSHNTSSRFMLILDALEHHLDGADPTEVFLWLDVFSVNQHVRGDATKQDLDQLEQVIQAASGGTLVILDPQATQITRTWCLFEIWATIRHHGTEALHLLTPGFSLSDAAPAFLLVDVRQSQSRFSPDRTKIMDRIGGADGRGHREINMQVKLLFVLQPMDYKDSMQQILQSWRLGALMQRNMAKWMDKYMNWLELPTSHPSYKCFAINGPPGCGKTMLSAGMCSLVGDKLDLRPHAWHLTSAFNMNRLNPISILKTMAFQLAHKIPETQTYMLNLDHAKVSKLTQVDAAFNMLVRIPLARLAREGKAPSHGVIFLVDGLDEAQQPGSSTMPELVSMLRDMFPLLPTFCRLVCTCRTEADVPHIVQSMRAKLGPLEVSTRDLLPKDDLLMAMEVQLNSVMEAQANLPDVAARIFRKGYDSLLYAAVVLQGMQTGEPHHWSVDELNQLPTELPQVYAALFVAALSSLSPEDKNSVKALLQVLAAVREPASLSHIHQMGLKHALKLLPGWGLLFYTSQFKVHMLHKTLLDWLRRLDPELVSTGYAEAWVPPRHADVPTPVAAAPVAPVAAPAPAPAPPRSMKKNMGVSVKHAVPERDRSESSNGAAAGPNGSEGGAGSGGAGRKESIAPGSGAASSGASAAVSAAAAAELQRRQAAADDMAARLADLLGGKPNKLVMTIDMAQKCDMVLDVAEGHAMMASLLLQDIRSSTPHDYSLKHAVAHLCMAKDIERLEELVLDFDFWQAVYTAGYGPLVLRDLLELMPEDSAIAMDVGRWLRGVHKTLVLQPKAVLQLAADAPRNSFTSKAAMKFRSRPDGMLINKETHWSPNLMVLWEPGSGRISSIALSPDGLRIAGGSTSKNVRLWDVKTGSPAGILEGPSSVFNCVAFFSDGSKLASGSADKTIRVWDAKSGETACVLEGHKDNVTSVCVSSDMSKLASGSADKTVRLWDLKLMEEIAVLEGHRDTVYSVSFAMDGLKVASGGGDRTVRLWDAKAKKLILSMDGHFGVIYCVACSPFSTHIASASSDKTIRIWDSETGQQLAALEGHQAGVSCIAYSSNGSVLASCSSDKTFRVWDPKQFTQLLVVERQVGTFNSICFAQQDCSQLVTASSDKTLRVWDSKTGEELALLEGHMDGVVSVAMAGDGIRAASASLDKTVRTWDLKVEEQVAVLKGQSGVFSSVCFSPNGQYLVTGSDDRTVRLWDAKTCQQVSVSEGHMECVRAVAFSPDNRLVASGSDDHTVKLWEVPSGAAVYTMNQIIISSGAICCLCFSPDGIKIATGASDTYKTVRQWDVQSGKQLTESKGHFGVVNSVAYSPDGSTLASAASDRTVRIWDASNGQVLQVLDGHEQAVTSVAYCTRTGRVASGSDDCSIRIWEHNGKTWAQATQFAGHNSRLTGLVFHPDGTKLCSSGKETIRIWSMPRPGPGVKVAGAAGAANGAAMRRSLSISGTAAAQGQRMSVTGATSMRNSLGASLSGADPGIPEDAPEPLPGHSGMINCITFSPSGLIIATASYDKTIRLWNSGTGRVVTVLKGHSGVVNTVVWSPDGTKLASGGADETVRVWDAKAGVELHTLQGHSNWVRTVAFSPLSARLISGSDAGEVKLWEVKSGQALGSLEGHTGWVRCVAWSPDDTKVASCSEDRSIRTWDSKHTRIIHVMDGHSDYVTCVEFSPNGLFLASGSEDKSVRLWNCGTGRCIAEFKGHYGMVSRVRFSPDSSLVSSSCADKVFRVWDTKSLKEVKVMHPCTDGMWFKDLLLTVSADTGVISLWDGRTLQPVAQAYSTFQIRDIAFSGMLVACTTTGMGPDSVAVYRLTVPPRPSHHQHYGQGGVPAAAGSGAEAVAYLSASLLRHRSPSPQHHAHAASGKGAGAGGPARRAGPSSPVRAAGGGAAAARPKAGDNRTSPVRTGKARTQGGIADQRHKSPSRVMPSRPR